MGDEKIAAACENVWDDDVLQKKLNIHGNCSGYLKKVAEKLGYSLPDVQANELMDWLDKKSGWVKIVDEKGRFSGTLAQTLAKQGIFVIADQKHPSAKEHGHVAVVVDGPLYNKKYPRVWSGGGIRGRSAGDKSVGETWPRSGGYNRDKVKYYAPPGTVLPRRRAFLKIDGIPGESTDAEHKGWIEVFDFSNGITQPASTVASTAGGGTTGRASFDQLSISKFIDSSTPRLSAACSDGRHIKEVILELYRDGGSKPVKYMEYKITNCIISSVQVEGGQNQPVLPVEDVSFSFGRIELAYIQQDRTSGRTLGMIAAGWDLERNRRC